MSNIERTNIEKERLKEVESFHFLEDEPQTIFVDTTRALRQLFKAEIAFVCFVGEKHQRFISEIGMQMSSSLRSESVCTHTILQEIPLCVRDTLEDRRFNTSALVLGPPHLRFYAGAPLITRKGYKIGTIAVAGTEPRDFSPEEQDGLASLARLVVHQIEDLKEKHEKATEAQRLKTFLEDVTNVMTEGLAVFDEKDRLIYFNKRYQEYYDKNGHHVRRGRLFRDILLDGLKEGYYPEAFGREEEWLEERLERHLHPPEEPFEQHLASGEWILVSEKRLPNGGIMGVRTDISALKQKEHEIRTSEKRFRDYTRTASDWIWETDTGNRMTLLAGNHRHLSGIRKQDVLGKTRNEVTIEDTATDKWRELDAKIAKHEPFRDFAYQIKASDGSDQVISISGVPFYDARRNFLGYRGTGRRITEEVRSKERLLAAEARIRAALKNTLVGMVLIDTEGTVLEFNREAERMFQYQADEVIGRNVSMLMPQEYACRHDGYLEAYQRTGEERIIGHARRLMGQRKDGTQFPLTLGVGKINLAGGLQFIGSLTDLTEQENLENQLQRAQKLEAIGQLTGGIAHDFNNILGIIMGNLELGRRKSEPGSKLAGYFDKAHTAAERATKITQQLLSFSRQKEYYAESVTCDLNHAIEDVEALLRGSIPKSIDLKIAPAATPLIAQVDTGDLQDVLINLAVNARDAMNNSGRLTIELGETTLNGNRAPGLSELAKGRYGVLSVSDSGPGIPREIRARIFEPFFTTKPKGHGTGLGLAMVYGFVKRSRGDVKVYSETGIGTSFRIYLPLVDDSGHTAGPQAADPTSTPRGTECILIVDDEPELAGYAQTTLEELGYTVVTSSSPDDALEILQSRPEIDLLFSDVVMPGPMNGIDLCTRARKMRPGLKTLLTSGFPGEVLVPAVSPDPDILVKPYSQRKLAQAIRQRLDEGTNA